MSVATPLADRDQIPSGRLIRTFPLLPGKRGALAGFVAELAARPAETQGFYCAHGVLQESIRLRTTPEGDFVIVCAELGEPALTVAKLAPVVRSCLTRVDEAARQDPWSRTLSRISSSRRRSLPSGSASTRQILTIAAVGVPPSIRHCSRSPNTLPAPRQATDDLGWLRLRPGTGRQRRVGLFQVAQNL
jgi:hypothetical protein